MKIRLCGDSKQKYAFNQFQSITKIFEKKKLEQCFITKLSYCAVVRSRCVTCTVASRQRRVRFVVTENYSFFFFKKHYARYYILIPALLDNSMKKKKKNSLEISQNICGFFSFYFSRNFFYSNILHAIVIAEHKIDKNAYLHNRNCYYSPVGRVNVRLHDRINFSLQNTISFHAFPLKKFKNNYAPHAV